MLFACNKGLFFGGLSCSAPGEGGKKEGVKGCLVVFGTRFRWMGEDDEGEYR